jgi:catechol 2,3-dioxygenase-like lactoylglutathione lyase family enzyme
MTARPHLTHVATRSRDVAKSVEFYARFVGLHIVHDRTDETGVRVVWLSEEPHDPHFVLVIIGIPHEEYGERSLAEHFGYDLPSREAVDEIAARGAAEGLLLQGPVYAGPIVGYFCMLRDPDGNIVEFSHGQPINPRQLGS